MSGPIAAIVDAAAFHEAAHAVVASALGVNLRSKIVVPPANRVGPLRHRSPLTIMDIHVEGPGLARETAESAIKICLAGPIAYRKRRPQSWRDAYGLGDYETAMELARRASGSSDLAGGILEGLLLQTLVLVDRHWKEIAAVAAALVAQGSLTGAELAEVLRNPEREFVPTATPAARKKRESAHDRKARHRRPR